MFTFTSRPLLTVSSPDEPRRSCDPVRADLSVQQGRALSSTLEPGDTGGPAREEHYPGAFPRAQLHEQTGRCPLRAQPVAQIRTDEGKEMKRRFEGDERC